MKKRKQILWITGILAAAAAGLYFLGRPLPDEEAGEPLLVFCAAGAKTPVLELAREFSAEYGVNIELRFGGCGSLLHDLEASRTGDLYIATDQSFINMASGKNLTADTFPLAAHRPVLVVLKNNPKDIRFLSDLQRPLLRLALGEPEDSAIGRQTRNLFYREDVWEQIRERVEDRGVFKATAPEVAEAVDEGSADAGIAWSSTASQFSDLEVLRIPPFDNAPQQTAAAAILRSGRQPDAALRFARYLQSAAGRRAFREAGFDLLEPADELQ